MIKAVLLDGDGVTLKMTRYFSEIYSEKYNVPLEEIMPFFKGPFREVQKGDGDLKDALAPFLPKWKWQGSVDDFLEYWHTSNTIVDEQVLEVAKKIRDSRLGCYLVSDQDPYRAKYMKEVLNFDDYFTGTFLSCDLNHTKSDPEFFRLIMEQLKLLPEEIAYFDNEEKDVESARIHGINANLYTDIHSFTTRLQELGINITGEYYRGIL